MTSSSPAYPRARHLLGWPFAAGLAGIVAAEMFGSSMADGAWRSVAIPAWYAAWGGWAVWLCRRKGIGLRRLVGRWPGERAAWRYVGMALPLLLLSTGLFLLQVAVAARMAPERVHDWLAEDPTAPAASTASSALELLAVLALAPVVEELVFRGVLLPGWSRRRGRRTAVLGTAALFAMLHPTDLLGSLVFGVVLAAIRLRTRTLLVPIACHALFNALVVPLGAAVSPLIGGTDDPSFTADELRSMLWVGAGCVAASLPVLAVFLRRHTRLWVPQRLHRVQPRGPTGGSEPEEESA